MEDSGSFRRATWSYVGLVLEEGEDVRNRTALLVGVVVSGEINGGGVRILIQGPLFAPIPTSLLTSGGVTLFTLRSGGF